nr:MAG TPA: hypothetical protein [Caudoviricetes sp.]
MSRVFSNFAIEKEGGLLFDLYKYLQSLQR